MARTFALRDGGDGGGEGQRRMGTEQRALPDFGTREHLRALPIHLRRGNRNLQTYLAYNQFR